MEYSEYIALRNRAMDEGWHHWQRIAAYRAHSRPELGWFLARVGGYRWKAFHKYRALYPDTPKIEVHHAVTFNDPYDHDAPVKILHPSVRCVEELMAGGIHPPIEAVHRQRLRLETDDGETIECNRIDAPRIRAMHSIKGETVIDNSAAHLTVAMPMSYEQAIEWIIMKDIPFDVWGRQHNRRMMAIVHRDAIPKDRTSRNHWKLEDLAA